MGLGTFWTFLPRQVLGPPRLYRGFMAGYRRVDYLTAYHFYGGFEIPQPAATG
jgi:hypothetical protein